MSKKKKQPFIRSPFTTAWYGPMLSHLYGRVRGNVFSAPRKRSPHKVDKDKTDAESCPCDAFKKCDLCYQQLSDEQRLVWKNAVKKPGMTAYTLFMKENLVCAMHTGKFVQRPSVSGGFSCRHLIYGGGDLSHPFIGLLPPPPPPPPVYGEECDICTFLGDPETPLGINCEFSGFDGVCDPFNLYRRLDQTERTCWWEYNSPWIQIDYEIMAPFIQLGTLIYVPTGDSIGFINDEMMASCWSARVLAAVPGGSGIFTGQQCEMYISGIS